MFNWLRGGIIGLLLLLLGCVPDKSSEDYAQENTEPPAVSSNNTLPSEIQYTQEPAYPTEADDFAIDTHADTSFATPGGDSIQIAINYYYLNEITATPFVYMKAPCKFKVGEKLLGNYAVRLKVLKNRKLFYEQEFTKHDFVDILKKSYIKNNVLTGAKFVSYNKRYKQMVFLFTLAEANGGTDWYGQAYLTLDLKGNIVQKGLVDYPHHCNDLFSISSNYEYILTCAEFADFKGTRRKFDRGSVALAKFINDSLYTVVYDLVRDSLVCDTLIYWQTDTLTAADYKLRPDTASVNAFIFHVNGDTVASFRFDGYTDYGEGYVCQFNYLKAMQLVTYYDFKKEILYVFDVQKSKKIKPYSVKKLKRYQANGLATRTIQFKRHNVRGKNSQVKFYFNNAKKVIGYAYSA